MRPLCGAGPPWRIRTLTALGWVRELAERVLALPADAATLLAARERIGWAQVWPG
ncbi:hypothetical protein ACQPZX_17330 [Actinoplanes sp. CA-142083]|uniref:hypothetical protein n=1 Tax=Actinoplanes sp. CA-142083 TaxID=3239903 RepID=UPI003D8C10BC